MNDEATNTRSTHVRTACDDRPMARHRMKKYLRMIDSKSLRKRGLPYCMERELGQQIVHPMYRFNGNVDLDVCIPSGVPRFTGIFFRHLWILRTSVGAGLPLIKISFSCLPVVFF